MRRSLTVLIVTGMLAGASVALAHHSPAVFDRTREVKLSGVVKEFRWSNPHSFIELEVREANGAVHVWAVEMNPPSYLIKVGWRASTIKAGDAVTVMINPLRTDEKVGKFVSITLADGRVLKD
jgi:hypothetical protein